MARASIDGGPWRKGSANASRRNHVKRLAAVRYFDPAYVSSGSKREAALFCIMSASTSYGHAATKWQDRVMP
jgi:hypothetical protein